MAQELPRAMSHCSHFYGIVQLSFPDEELPISSDFAEVSQHDVKNCQLHGGSQIRSAKHNLDFSRRQDKAKPLCQEQHLTVSRRLFHFSSLDLDIATLKIIQGRQQQPSTCCFGRTPMYVKNTRHLQTPEGPAPLGRGQGDKEACRMSKHTTHYE